MMRMGRVLGWQWRPGRIGAAVAVLLGLLALGLLWVCHERAGMRLDFTVQSTHPGQLQVFFHEEGEFNEQMTRWYGLQAGRSQRIELRKLGPQLARIRIDPPSGSEVSLCGIRLAAAGGMHGYVVAASHQVELANAGGCLRLSSAADAPDPLVVLVGDETVGAALPAVRQWEARYEWMLGACVLALAVVLVGLRWLILAPFRRFNRLEWLGRLDAHAHWVCAALMLVFGCLYALRTPPGAVPDEAAHLEKVVMVRAGATFGGDKGELFPDVRRMYGPFIRYLDNKAPFTEEQLERQLDKPVVCEPGTPGLMHGADPYFPHQYALATGAYAVACAADAPFGVFLYSARLLNLLLATLLVGIGVAFAARAKWALAFVALLPMSLSQMASLSADSLVIGLSIAWIGLTTGLAAGRVQLQRAIPYLWVLAISIGLLKPGAAWILASLLFCHAAFRESGRSFVRALACFVAFPWLLHLLLIMCADSAAIVRSGVDPDANARLLLHDPSVFLGMVWNTFSGDSGQHMYHMLIGILGWIDVPLSGWAYVVAAYALAATPFLGNNHQPDRLRWGVVAPVSLVFAVGSIVLLSLPLYARWTALDAGYVQGLQGRYFLPTLAFALAGVSLKASDALRLFLLAFVLGAAVALNLDALGQLHQAYFVVGR